MITVGDFWMAAGKLAVAPLAIVAPGRTLILAPHPDDESLGCGGLIAEACSQDLPPLVAVLTDGSKSHPNSAAYPAGRLRALREAETLEAVACLGLPSEHVVFLRYQDAQAPTTGAALEEAAARVATLLRGHACGSIVAPWQHDPHCDHQAAHAIARLAAQHTGVVHRAYPVWGLTLPADHPVEAPPQGLRLNVSRHLAAKRRAIRTHASQHAGLIDDDPTGFQMQPSFISLFDTPFELYLDPT